MSFYNKVKVRGKRRQPAIPVKVGQARRPQAVRGGGGPANAGARNSAQANKLQPNFRNAKGAINSPYAGEFDGDEYKGYAAPSRTPDLSGIPMNNFRHLGDKMGGRG